MVVLTGIRRWSLLIMMLALVACSKEPKLDASLDITRLLGAGNTAGFSQALELRDFSFPADHAAHDDFRNEWWYLTGNLKAKNGRRYGYQVTFFRTGLAANPLSPTPQEADPRSGWAARNVWMAHAAITDIDAKTHFASQRFSRENPGLAGARADPFRVWLDDWQLAGDGNDFPWMLHIRSDDFSLELALTAVKPPVLQGDRGLSRKSDTPGNASYYYSYTRLASRGKLWIGGDAAVVEGLSWFDREWSTSTLDRQQSGWNWFSLQLDSGEDMMFFQLLDLQGNADGNSQGSWISADGEKTSLPGSAIQLKMLAGWESEYGQVYPVRWQLEYPARGKSWIIAAPVDDQFMDLAVKYWEGAVEVLDSNSNRKIGQGYLEMTRTRR